MATPEELLKQAEELYDKNQYQQVIDLLSDEVLEQNKDAVLYNIRGMSFDEMKEYDRAIVDYCKVIEINPNLAIAYSNRGLSWHNKGEYDKAIADYDRSIALQPDLADAYYNRGNTWKHKSENEKAIADYSKAIELQPESVFYNNRGVSWKAKGENDKAIADYDKAIALDSNYTLAYSNLGHLYFDIEAYEKAVFNMQKALELNPNRFSFLKDKILLAQEKIEERKAIEESGISKEDWEQRLAIEKKIDEQIQKILELAQSKVQRVVHYTKTNVIDIYVKSSNVKMHYSNAIYMNDPMEGKVFFGFLNDKNIEEAYRRGEKRTETSVYLGSFLPAENDIGDISHEDELVMWRTYGKGENDKEAAGCNAVLSADFFQSQISQESENGGKIKGKDNELLNVVYIKRTKQESSITNDVDGKIEAAFRKLKKELSKLLKIRNKYQPNFDVYRSVEDSIFKKLSVISYLFKSADYEFEHEVRVIKYISRNSESIKYMENMEQNTPCKKFYIESDKDILPYIEKIYLGPKVENAAQWALYFDYEIRQRAKDEQELENSDPDKYNAIDRKINPSKIDIIRSECHFQ